MNLSGMSSTSEPTLESAVRTVPNLKRSSGQKLHFSRHRSKGKEKEIKYPNPNYLWGNLF